jgi:Plasmid pRiA4b ORF-3-like protein
MPEPANGALPMVYQLRVLLREISPLIWRRLLVPAQDSIADLHAALQIAFGWDGTHLHRFVIHGREYGSDSRQDPSGVRLCDLGLRVGERFTYEYDFTDYWVHDIRLEAIHQARPGRRYPVLIGGRRSAPPDGCGGAWPFLALRQQHAGAPLKLLRVLGELLGADPGQRIDEILGDRYEEFLELCRWTLIDRFDRRAANRQLRDMGDRARSTR